MKAGGCRYVYGPVPSRRLGRSLGIDLVPLKTCTYDCVYCQLGRTTNKTIDRREYVPITDVLTELEDTLSLADTPDYISIAGSGEPTLHLGIGELINQIKTLTNIPVAVLTNGSLLWIPEVQESLMAADLVLPSLDAGDAFLFRYVNRPHADITFEQMIDGIASFTKRFPGKVWLEVLLLGGVTGITAEVKKIASIISRIKPDRVQLNTVCRPPAEDFVFQLPMTQMLELQDLFPGVVEIISENREDILHSAVHPDLMDDDILGLLRRRPCTSLDVAGGFGVHVMEALKSLEALSTTGKVTKVSILGSTFYVASSLDGASRS